MSSAWKGVTEQQDQSRRGPSLDKQKNQHGLTPRTMQRRQRNAAPMQDRERERERDRGESVSSHWHTGEGPVAVEIVGRRCATAL